MDRRPWNPPARPVVLLIDGHEDTRAMYAFALSAMGFDVVAAQDDAEAYRRAWQVHPDIIVIDLPPNHDGGQFVQDLKENSRTRDIPLIAVSEDARGSLCEYAERNGFAAVFLKPCLPDQLAAALRHVLDGEVHARVER